MSRRRPWDCFLAHIRDAFRNRNPGNRTNIKKRAGEAWATLDLTGDEKQEYRALQERVNRLYNVSANHQNQFPRLRARAPAFIDVTATGYLRDHDRAIAAVEDLLQWQATRGDQYPVRSYDYCNELRLWLHRWRGQTVELREHARRRVRARNRTVAEPMDNDLLMIDAQGQVPGNFAGQPGWNGGWPLGQGGQGFVVLWTRVDAHGNIQDRQAVKDTFLMSYHWDSAHNFWHQKAPTMIPTEIHALQRLRDQTQVCTTIIRMNTWAPHYDIDTPYYRMYLEYAPHGSLSQLGHWYRHKTPADGRDFVHPDDCHSINIPEPFIWWLFDCLVEAARAMESALFDEDKPNDTPVIVHRDLKPQNVFLGCPSTTAFRQYPAPKIGDFGLAIITDPADRENPRAYKGAGSEGYRAPEQTEMHHADGSPPFRFGSPTNIWQIGKTILAMMCQPNDTPPNAPNNPRRQPSFNLADQVPLFSKRAMLFSRTLRELVKSCMALDPADRPTYDQLRRRIDRHTGGTGAAGAVNVDLAGGLRAGGLEISDGDRLRYEQTPWRLGRPIPDAFRDLDGMVPYNEPEIEEEGEEEDEDGG